MLIVHVFVKVKPQKIAAFKAASIQNARESVKEPGVAGFDVIQQKDDPTRFVFIQKNDDGWHGRDRRFVAPV